MSIKIIIDSASDISEAEAKQLGIQMIPMIVSIGDEDYLDGVDLLPTAFYEKLVESDLLPKTSQITAFRFEEVFDEAVKDGSEVVVITISSKLSGTYDSAKQAAKKYGDKVYVIDSLNACIGERLLCLYAISLREKGLNAKEIAAELERKKSKIHVMAMVNTLEYLRKGGRISITTAIAGEILSIKPVVGMIDGEVKMLGKAMGSKRANNLLNALVQRTGIDFTMPYGIIWSGLNDALLQKYVRDSASLWEGHTTDIPAYIIGSTIGTHVGPGAIGVAFFEK